MGTGHTSRGYPYPDGQERVKDGAAAIAALANAINSDVGGLAPTTGWITLPLKTGFVADNADNVPQYLKNGRRIWLRGLVRKTDGTVYGYGTFNVAALAGALAPETPRTSNFAVMGLGGVGAVPGGAFCRASDGLSLVTTQTGGPNTNSVALDNISYWAAS